jgi:hypothetical protein
MNKGIILLFIILILAFVYSLKYLAEETTRACGPDFCTQEQILFKLKGE